MTVDSGGDTSTPDGGEGGDATKAFAPSDFGGRLALWLEASPKNLIVSDAGDEAVVQWKLSSTSALPMTVPSGNACAGASAASLDAGAVRNVVRFGLWCQELGNENGQPSLDFGTREFLIEIVAKLDPSMAAGGAIPLELGGATPLVPFFERREVFGHLGTFGIFDDLGHAQGPSRAPDHPDAAATQTLLSANAALSDHAFHIIGARRIKQAALTKDTISVRIDGVHEEQQGDPVSLDFGGANFRFGGDYPGIGPVYGYDLEIAEIVVLAAKTAAPVSDAEVKTVELYLSAKDGIPAALTDVPGFVGRPKKEAC